MRHDELTDEVIAVLRAQVFTQEPPLETNSSAQARAPSVTESTYEAHSSDGSFLVIPVLILLVLGGLSLLFYDAWQKQEAPVVSAARVAPAEPRASAEPVRQEAAPSVAAPAQTPQIWVTGTKSEEHGEVVRRALRFLWSVNRADYYRVVDNLRIVQIRYRTSLDRAYLFSHGYVAISSLWWPTDDPNPIRLLAMQLLYLTDLRFTANPEALEAALLRHYGRYLCSCATRLVLSVRSVDPSYGRYPIAATLQLCNRTH